MPKKPAEAPERENRREEQRRRLLKKAAKGKLEHEGWVEVAGRVRGRKPKPAALTANLSLLVPVGRVHKTVQVGSPPLVSRPSR
jgi:hypothetical protein